MAEQLWRAVAVYRIAALAYAAALVITNHDSYAHPVGGWIVLAAMVVWTAVTVTGYADARRRHVALLVADVLVAAGAVLATVWVETSTRIDAGAPTLPAAWAAAAVLACAVAGGAFGGGVAAAAVAAADLVERADITESTFNGIVLLLLAGIVGGYVVQLALRAEADMAAATRREAAADERERLARSIHDSVLQVLALVARRGAEIGGESAELARLAADQEISLRALVTTPAPEVDTSGEIDLRALVQPLAGDGVTVSCPASPVRLRDPVAREVVAAVGEALANARRHAGAEAHAWVLVEDDADGVTISVRDDGAGIADGRLDQARHDGRLGVAQSILGRMHDLGGTATVTSSPGTGTEVELRVPRQ